LPVARCKGALIGALATACLFFAPSAWGQAACDPGLSYSGLVSTNPLAGVHAQLTPLKLPSVRSGWAASWVGVGDSRTVSGAQGRAIRVGLIAHSEDQISLVYEVHRAGQPVKAREIYRYVKRSETHGVSVVSSKRHPSRWVVKVGGRRVSPRILMRPGSRWRAFTTVESAVANSGECNTLAYRVTKATKATRKRTRHDVKRNWSPLTRAFQASGILSRQPSTNGFVVSTSDTSDPTPDPAEPRLTWAPPRLTTPTTIKVGSEGGQFNLAPGKDYVVRIRDVNAVGGVRLIGGRNIVVIGGHITIPWAGKDASIGDRLGLYLKNQTGTVHVEGLLIDNAGGDLSEGIQISAPDAVVQIENCRIEGIHARDEANFTDNHPDLIQPWGGVKALRVDGFTGVTDYQGFFLVGSHGAIGKVDLRNANIIGTGTSRYLFWQEDGVPVGLRNIWMTPAKNRSLGWSVWPDKNAADPRTAIVNPDGSVQWQSATGITGRIFSGDPPNGDLVTSSSVGPGYVSPGYE
jgi:hypothetical protein